MAKKTRRKKGAELREVGKRVIAIVAKVTMNGVMIELAVKKMQWQKIVRVEEAKKVKKLAPMMVLIAMKMTRAKSEGIDVAERAIEQKAKIKRVMVPITIMAPRKGPQPAENIVAGEGPQLIENMAARKGLQPMEDTMARKRL